MQKRVNNLRERGNAMTFFILAYVIGAVMLIVPVWVGYKNHMTIHSIDMMAGDEGED